MEDTGPLTLFVWFLKSLIFWVAIALGWLWLVRRKFGGYDLKDWVVALGAFGAALLALFVSNDLQARYLEEVGSSGQGTLVRKWLEEGDDSTTYKVAVHYGQYEDDFEVREGAWDAAQPNTPIDVYYDPDYPADFVPKIRAASSPPAEIVVGMLGTAGLVIPLGFGWVLARTIERFRTLS